MKTVQFWVQIVSSIGAGVTTFSAFYQFKDSTYKFPVYVSLSVLSLVIVSSVILLIIESQQNKPIEFELDERGKRKIRDFMYSWLRLHGRAVIFTRDMSWVDDAEMKNMLKDKASRSDLIICLPDKSRFPDAAEFERVGAQIIEYSNLNIVPDARFTIVNFNRGDAEVAVGQAIRVASGKKIHRIETYRNGENPWMIANDLVKILGAK